MKKRVLSLIIAALVVIAIALVPTFADVTKYLVKTADDSVLEFELSELSESYRNYLLGLPGAELYLEYSKGTLIAVYDSERGYIDYEDIKNAYREKLLRGESDFVLNYYVRDNGVPAKLPEQVTEVKISQNGELEKVTKVINEPAPEDGIQEFKTLASLEPGKITVLVTLKNSTPDKYDVYLKNTKLTFDLTSKKFIGDVLAVDAKRENVSIREKSSLPSVKTFQTVASLEIGKTMVVITLNTETPEKYDVYIKDIKLLYNADLGKFFGDVPNADAVQSNVVLKIIQ